MHAGVTSVELKQPAGRARDEMLLAGRSETGVNNKGERVDGEVNLEDEGQDEYEQL